MEMILVFGEPEHRWCKNKNKQLTKQHLRAARLVVVVGVGAAESEGLPGTLTNVSG